MELKLVVDNNRDVSSCSHNCWKHHILDKNNHYLKAKLYKKKDEVTVICT